MKNKKSKNVKIILVLIKILLSLILMSILIYKVGAINLYSIIKSVNPVYLIAAIFMQFTIFTLEAFNIQRLVNVLKSVKYTKILKYHLLSLSVSFFTPGRLGQFSIVYLLKKDITIGEGTAVAVIDKITTLCSLSIISIFAFFILLPLDYALKATLFLFVVGFITIFFLISNNGRILIKRFILRKYAKYFKGFSKKIYMFYSKHILLIIFNLLINMIKWFLTAVMMSLFFLSLGFNINLWYVFIITALGVIISFIPISINGIGVRESAAVFLYRIIGVSSVVVMGVYILNLIINYIIATIIIILYLQDFKK